MAPSMVEPLPSPSPPPPSAPAQAATPTAASTPQRATAPHRTSMPSLVRSQSLSHALSTARHPMADTPLPPALGMRSSDIRPLPSPAPSAPSSADPSVGRAAAAQTHGRDTAAQQQQDAPAGFAAGLREEHSQNISIQQRRIAPDSGAAFSPHHTAHRWQREEQSQTTNLDQRPNREGRFKASGEERSLSLDSDRSMSSTAAFPVTHASNSSIVGKLHIYPTSEKEEDLLVSPPSNPSMTDSPDRKNAGLGGPLQLDAHRLRRNNYSRSIQDVGPESPLGVREAVLSAPHDVEGDTRTTSEQAHLTSTSALPEPTVPTGPNHQLSAILERSPDPTNADKLNKLSLSGSPASRQDSNSRPALLHFGSGNDATGAMKSPSSHLSTTQNSLRASFGADRTRENSEETGTSLTEFAPQTNLVTSLSGPVKASTSTTHAPVSRSLSLSLSGRRAHSSMVQNHDNNTPGNQASSDSTGAPLRCRPNRLSLQGRPASNNFANAARASKARASESSQLLTSTSGGSATADTISPRRQPAVSAGFPSTPQSQRLTATVDKEDSEALFPAIQNTSVTPTSHASSSNPAPSANSNLLNSGKITRSVMGGSTPRQRLTSQLDPSASSASSLPDGSHADPNGSLSARSIASLGGKDEPLVAKYAGSRRSSVLTSHPRSGEINQSLSNTFGTSTHKSSCIPADSASAAFPVDLELQSSTAVGQSQTTTPTSEAPSRRFSPPANMRGPQTTPRRRILAPPFSSAAASGLASFGAQNTQARPEAVLASVASPSREPASAAQWGQAKSPIKDVLKDSGQSDVSLHNHADISSTNSLYPSPQRRSGLTSYGDHRDEGVKHSNSSTSLSSNRGASSAGLVADTATARNNSPGISSTDPPKSSLPRTRVRYTTGLPPKEQAIGPSSRSNLVNASASSSTPSTAPLPNSKTPSGLPASDPTVDMSTAKSTPNAQTTALRNKLQVGFGEIRSPFQAPRTAGEPGNAPLSAPGTTFNLPKGTSTASRTTNTNTGAKMGIPFSGNAKMSRLSTANHSLSGAGVSANSGTGTSRSAANIGTTLANRQTGHHARRSLIQAPKNLPDFEPKDPSHGTRVEHRLEPSRRRTTTLPGTSPGKPPPSPMLPPLSIAPLEFPSCSQEKETLERDVPASFADTNGASVGTRRRSTQIGLSNSKARLATRRNPEVTNEKYREDNINAHTEVSPRRGGQSSYLETGTGAGTRAAGSATGSSGISQFGVPTGTSAAMPTGSLSRLSQNSAARAPSRIPRAIPSLRQSERERTTLKEPSSCSSEFASTTAARKVSAPCHVLQRSTETEMLPDTRGPTSFSRSTLPSSSSASALLPSSNGPSASSFVGSRPTAESGVNPTISILNAYTSAKTQMEIDSVMRRARVAAHGSHLTTSEREILQSLFTKEKKSHAASKEAQVNAYKDVPGEHINRINKEAAKEITKEATKETTKEATKEAYRASDFGPAKVTSSLSSYTTSVATRRSIPLRTARPSMPASMPEGMPPATAAARQGPAPLGQSALGLALRGPHRNGSRNSIASPLTPQWDDEQAGDEEMAGFARRAEARKRQAGASQEDLDALLSAPPPEAPSRALSRRQAEVIHGPYLNSFELREMYDFDTFYYCGQNANNKYNPSLDQPEHNFGYDDERGDYRAVSRDHLAYRYEVVDLLGRGSFGQVLRCKDHKTGEWVAIKLIRNKERFHSQALVEVDILHRLTQWDPDDAHNAVRMTHSFTFRNHLCISTELLNINLYELIKANGFVGLSLRLVRRITTQSLATLCLLRKHKVVHCDLKPENILLVHPAKSAIKVIDFGSSCFESERVYTYIQSRFYRSPEVILGLNYHMAIDMWSLGCIIAELYTGYPLFPGENEQEQLACIMEVFGLPEKHLIDRSSRKKFFFDNAGQPRPIKSKSHRRRRPGSKTLAQLLRQMHTRDGISPSPDPGLASSSPITPAAAQAQEDLFIDFVSRCLAWDPERRMKPEQALRHPWIMAGRRPSPRMTTTTIALSSSDAPEKSLVTASGPAPSSTTAAATSSFSRRATWGRVEVP